MLAWLNAVPKPDKPALSQVADEPVSRLETMRQEGREPDMPPQPAPHIVGYLMEVGPVEAAGAGVGPVSWASIGEWQRQTGVFLPPWQATLLRRLSNDWVAESRTAEKVDAPPPWLMPGTVESRASVDAKLRAYFGALATGGDDG